MWVTIFVLIMQMGVSVAIAQVVFSAVHYADGCFYFNYAGQSFIAIQVTVSSNFLFLTDSLFSQRHYIRFVFLHFCKHSSKTKLYTQIIYKLATRVIQLFCFPDKPMKGGNILDFKKGGGIHLEKVGMTLLTNYENFFSCSGKELQKSGTKAKKLEKRHWIRTLWENGP